MAEVVAAEVPQNEKDELFCAYAGMILTDSELDVTEDNINKLIKASGGSIDSFYPRLFAKVCEAHSLASSAWYSRLLGSAMVADHDSDVEAFLHGRDHGTSSRGWKVAPLILSLTLVACLGVAGLAHTSSSTEKNAAIDAVTDSNSLLQLESVAPLHDVGNFIAALGSVDAQNGKDAQKWGLWEGDPGADGKFPTMLAKDKPSWYNPLDWWMEEHGMVMPNPKPLPAGEYKVFGDVTVGGPKLLTVSKDGHWALPEGVTLDDVTHHPCKAKRYMGTPGSGCAADRIPKCIEDGSPVEYKVLIVSAQSAGLTPDSALPKP